MFKVFNEDIGRCLGLIGNLPISSRVFEEEFGGKYFTDTDMLLSMIEYWSHLSVYINTEDAKNKRNAPTVMIPDHVKKAQEEYSMDPEERKKLSYSPEELREYIYGKSFS